MKSMGVILNQAKHGLKSNSPVILAGAAIVGVGATAYLAAQAGMKHQQKRHAMEPDIAPVDEAKLVWREYIPPVVAGVVTVGCIVTSKKIDARRAAALTAAYSVTEKAFDDYKKKVIEKIGENKERTARDEIAQEKIAANPPPKTIVIGSGSVLCCELYTGRYFESDMETLRRAMNDVNQRLILDMYVTLSDWYYMIGLPTTTHSSDIGWMAGKLMDLEFTSSLSDDDRPCLAFDYNYVRPID